MTTASLKTLEAYRQQWADTCAAPEWDAVQDTYDGLSIAAAGARTVEEYREVLLATADLAEEVGVYPDLVTQTRRVCGMVRLVVIRGHWLDDGFCVTVEADGEVIHTTATHPKPVAGYREARQWVAQRHDLALVARSV